MNKESPEPIKAAAAEDAPESRHVLARNAWVISMAVMLSRVLGLAREMIFSSLFGAGRNMDIFTTAFRTPNLLRDLFAEGALSTAFITTFSKRIAVQGDAAAWELANKVRTLLTVFMSVITVLGILFAPLIVRILAPGFDGEKAEMTVLLVRIMYPFILMVSLAALVMGMLNAKRIFAVPALASSFFNIGSILGGVIIGYYLDPSFGELALVGLAFGTLIGGGLQLLVQIPTLLKTGFRVVADFKWKDSGVAEVLRLMGPAVIAASAVQVNVMVNTMFASMLPEDGPVTWLSFAFRLMQLPLGLFGVAIATVTLPVVSKSAALGRGDEFRMILAKALRLAFFLTIPAAVGLMVLCQPIMDLLYGRGKVTEYEVTQMAYALQFYAIGLLGYSGLKVLTPVFYAIDRRWIPMMVSIGSIVLNIFLNWLLMFKLGLGHRGLALSTASVAIINFVILYYVMKRAAFGLESRTFLSSLLRVSIASGVMAVVAWLGYVYWIEPWQGRVFIWKAVALGGSISVAGVVYLGMTALLKVEETQDAIALVRRKLAGRFGKRR